MSSNVKQTQLRASSPKLGKVSGSADGTQKTSRRLAPIRGIQSKFHCYTQSRAPKPGRTRNSAVHDRRIPFRSSVRTGRTSGALKIEEAPRAGRKISTKTNKKCGRRRPKLWSAVNNALRARDWPSLDAILWILPAVKKKRKKKLKNGWGWREIKIAREKKKRRKKDRNARTREPTGMHYTMSIYTKGFVPKVLPITPKNQRRPSSI